MSNFVGTAPFLHLLWVAMEVMHFRIAQTGLCFGQLCFALKGPIKKMVPMKSCPRVNVS